MLEYDIYKDIAERTNGDIYVGVVGPVRTGKSTFISRFMEELIIPNISGSKKSVATDELPQSAHGKTIMTTEPKFVPSEAVRCKFGNADCKVKLIDCVGYMVSGALGWAEDDVPRMVKTPWSQEEMPFDKASEIGTKKVIEEHSTVGVVITTDGSFTEIPRADYEQAEAQVISELKSLNKPFVVVFNCQNPTSKQAVQQARSLEEKYGVTVICENVLTMDKSRFADIIHSILLEFPLKSFDVELPGWLGVLSSNNQLIQGLIANLSECSKRVTTMKSFCEVEKTFATSQVFNPISQVEMDMAKGKIKISLSVKNGVFYKVLSDECGEVIENELQLMQKLKDFISAKNNYDKLKSAIECAESTGYGIVQPTFAETELSEPEVVKKTGGYCVRMQARAKSLHVIRADLNAEVNPVYGTKKQCEDFVEYFNNADEENQWETGVFGRPLSAIITEEVGQNSCRLSDGVKYKLRKTVTRAVNEKKTNLFCILI